VFLDTAVFACHIAASDVADIFEKRAVIQVCGQSDLAVNVLTRENIES
jgi:hypothetical protein